MESDSENESTVYPLPDEQIADKAMSTLERLAPKAKTGEQPFFLAVGFHKPHLPFVFPEEYMQYYPKGSIKLPANPYVPKDSIKLPANPYVPKNFPDIAWWRCVGLHDYTDILATNATLKYNTSLPDFKTLELRRAYYSAMSFTDAQVGRVMDKLKELGLDGNTIVTFWADHGWQLGRCWNGDFSGRIYIYIYNI